MDDLGEFERWASGHGVHRPKVAVHRFEGCGLGLIATDDIHPGECLLSVPQGLFVSFYSVLRDSPIGALLCEVCHFADADDAAEYPDVLHEDEVVVVYLMYLSSLPDPSTAPWLRLWPSQGPTTDLWTDAELLTLPAHMQRRVWAHREAARHKYRDVHRILFSRHPAEFPPDVFTEERFLLANALFESRRFVSCPLFRPLATRPSSPKGDQEGDAAGEDDEEEEEEDDESVEDFSTATSPEEGEEAMADRTGSEAGELEHEILVPYADFLNHSFDGEANYYFDRASGCFIVIASRAYCRGEQVYIVYQEKYSNVDLGIYYGFTLPSVASRDYALIRGIDFSSSQDPELLEDMELRAVKQQLVQFYDLRESRLRLFPQRIGSYLLFGLRLKNLSSVQEARAFRGGPVSLLNEVRAHRSLLTHLLAGELRRRTEATPGGESGAPGAALEATGPFSLLGARLHRIEGDVCRAAINHFAVVIWRLSSCPDAADRMASDDAAQLRRLHEWALEFILTCREYGIALPLPTT